MLHLQHQVGNRRREGALGALPAKPPRTVVGAVAEENDTDTDTEGDDGDDGAPNSAAPALCLFDPGERDDFCVRWNGSRWSNLSPLDLPSSVECVEIETPTRLIELVASVSSPQPPFDDVTKLVTLKVSVCVSERERERECVCVSFAWRGCAPALRCQRTKRRTRIDSASRRLLRC